MFSFSQFSPQYSVLYGKLGI